MFQHQGIWLPDGEKHFPEWMTKNGELVAGRGTYQLKKIRASLGHCKSFRMAVDVGAHVGLWTMQLMAKFDRVYAFEPVAVFRACFDMNVKPQEPKQVLFPVALGRERGRVKMAYVPADSGGTHVSQEAPEAGEGVPMLTLDSYAFTEVDFLKMDCEGYEHHVVAGAEETIRRTWPTIIVEQKPHKLGPNFGIKGRPAVDLLKSWGYAIRAEISGDFIMVKQ